MMSIKDLFDSAVDDDEGSKPPKREMDRIKDGTYKAVVTDFSVFEKGGDFYVSWWFEVTDGLAAGAALQSFSGVTPKSVSFIKRSVARVIGSLPSWDDMYDEELGRTGHLQSSIVGRGVQITQKTNNVKGKDYVNVYVDKVINGASREAPNDGAGSEPQEAESTRDDDEVDVDDLF
jgi:hypothetical protein